MKQFYQTLLADIKRQDFNFSATFARLSRRLTEAIQLNDTAQQAELYLTLGILEGQRGDFASGVNHLELAVDVFERNGDMNGMAIACDHCGYCYQQLGDNATAQACFATAARLHGNSADV